MRPTYMCLKAHKRLCTRAHVTALNSSVIACCVRPQSCLFTLVWRNNRQGLLPPFLSDEAAYLAAPLRLSYFCFGPKAIKWHKSDGLDCSCLRVKHSETLQEKLRKLMHLTHTHARVYTYVHVKHTIVHMHSYVHWENSQLMLIQAYGSCVLDHD